MIDGEQAEKASARLRDGLVRIFGERLAAVWLYGATIFGHPSSDVDVHAILTKSPNEEEWVAIRALHDELAQALPTGEEGLDVWYVLLQAVRGSAPPTHLGPQGLVDDHWALHRAQWLAGRCVVLHGARPESILTPPTWADLEAVLRGEIERLEPSAYGVLQLCRTWASLETRDVVWSKLDSAAWALLRLDEERQTMVLAAVRTYEGEAKPGDTEAILDGFEALRREISHRISSSPEPLSSDHESTPSPPVPPPARDRD